MGIEKKEEDVLEAVSNLLSRTGKKLSENTSKEAKERMNLYFSRLNTLSRDPTLPARVRFMLQDLAEQRRNGWNLRREEQGAKTISEIKEDIVREERAKEAAAAAAQNRGRGAGGRSGGGRSGGGFGRRDPPRNAPATPMTMAPTASRGSSGNRPQSILEKYGGRSAASGGAGAGPGKGLLEKYALGRSPAAGAVGAGGGAAAGASAVRLGPNRSGGSGQWSKAGSGGASLRPGASGRLGSGSGAGGGAAATNNAFAALGALDTQDGASGDVRMTGRVSLGGGGGRWSSSRSSASVSDAAPAAPPTEPPMDHEKMKRKVKSIVTEFWGINDLKEARECVVEEVRNVNYTAFITEMTRFCLEARQDDRKKAVALYVGLLGEPIPRSCVRDGLQPLIGKLSDLEMDDPKAAYTLAMFLGAMAGSGKLAEKDGDAAFGLEFLKEAVKPIDDRKKMLKLMVLVFSELAKSVSESIPDDAARKAKITSAYEAVGVDLSTIALEMGTPRNAAYGSETLRDLLETEGLTYLIPGLAADIKLPAMLRGGSSTEEMVTAVKAGVPTDAHHSVSLARSLTLIGLSFVFEDAPTVKAVEERFKKCSGVMKEICCVPDPDPENTANPTAEAQMGVLLQVQGWLAEHAKDAGAELKPVPAVFQALYDDDIVEEDTFMTWKSDEKATLAVPGKQEAILQSTAFFAWLATDDGDDEEE